jgi:hypothetical protein
MKALSLFLLALPLAWASMPLSPEMLQLPSLTPSCSPGAVDALFALEAECYTKGAPTWNSIGRISGKSITVDGLTTSTDGSNNPHLAGSFYFNKVVKVVSGIDISPAAYTSLSLEVCVKRVNPVGNEWIIGHDNGGYDRAIALNDPRFAGAAASQGTGIINTAALGYPSLGKWHHVVATYGTNAKIYLDGVVANEGPARNGPGLTDFSIGGLVLYPTHSVDALISSVAVYDRELSALDIAARQSACLARNSPAVINCDTSDAIFEIAAECYVPGSPTWDSFGTIPGKSITVDGLIPSQDGTQDPFLFGSFLFNGVVKVVPGIDLGPAAHPALSLEVCVKRVGVYAAGGSSPYEWVVGHDNYGYDRAIALHDSRFGGVAAPEGTGIINTASLGYPNVGEWHHVVSTYGTDAKIYLDGVSIDEGVAKNTAGLPDFSIGGLVNFPTHAVNALISHVSVFDRELSAAEVQARVGNCLRHHDSPCSSGSG